jgi:predicted nucleic acid-binding protein
LGCSVRLVVADTGPLHYLLWIGHIDLIPKLFEKVILPLEVRDELSHAEAPAVVRSWIAEPPAWLMVLPAKAATTDPLLLRLDDGERAAITLAASVKADAILMDDRAGVAAARQKGFAVMGTLGILDAAARRGLVEMAEALERLRGTNFRFREELFEALLKKTEGRRGHT